MTPSQAWRKLGIAPTDDKRAVRRAYATKLKALDVDADPAGFERLREARDRAMWIARDKLHQESWNQADDAEEIEDEFDAADETGDDEPPPEPVAPAPSDDPHVREVEGLHALLYAAEADVALDGDERAAAGAHMQAALADPRLDEIDRRFDAEHWFAMTLAQTSPRSDPLLDGAAAFFGWRERTGQIGQNWWVDQVNARIDALAFRAELTGGEHHYSRAWRELTRPVPEDKAARRNFFIRRNTIAALLKRIREEHPSLEHELQPERVGVWEDAPEVGCSVPWILGVIAIQLVLAIARCDPAPSNTAVPSPVNAVFGESMTDENADVAEIVRRNFSDGVTEAMLKQHQPALAELLHINWRDFKGRGESRYAYFSAVGSVIREKTRYNRAKPGSELFLEEARHRLTSLIALRATPGRCVALALGQANSLAALPDNLRVKWDQIGRQIMLEGTPDPTPGRTRFTVSGAVIGKVIDRTGLPEARVRAGLRAEGAAADTCRVAIALREVALDLPKKQRDALLVNL